MVKKISYVFFSTVVSLGLNVASFAPVAHAQTTVMPGDLVRGVSTNGVYYVTSQMKRCVMVNERTYFTWYKDFSTVKNITDAELFALPLGCNVNYKPGKRLVKIDTDPKTYWVDVGGKLRHIPSEARAIELFGTTWNKQIDDIPDPLFFNYQVSDPLPATGPLPIIPADLTIDQDRGYTPVNPSQPKPATFHVEIKGGQFFPSNLTIHEGDIVVWTNFGPGSAQIASNPHPGHTENAILNGPVLTVNQTFSVTFNAKGTFGYHNHLKTEVTGTVVVVQ